MSADDARLVAKELATRLGVDATRDAIAAAPTDRLLAAQAALSEEISAAPDPARWGQVAANLMPFEPEVDGDVLPARPVDSVAAGQGADVDLLVGWNTDEHRLFLHPTGAIAAVDDALLDGVALALGLSPDAVPAYRRARPGASPGDVLAAVSTDWFFRIPAVRLAEARVGGRGPHVHVRVRLAVPGDGRRARRVSRAGAAVHVRQPRRRGRRRAHR